MAVFICGPQLIGELKSKLPSKSTTQKNVNMVGARTTIKYTNMVKSPLLCLLNHKFCIKVTVSHGSLLTTIRWLILTFYGSANYSVLWVQKFSCPQPIVVSNSRLFRTEIGRCCTAGPPTARPWIRPACPARRALLPHPPSLGLHHDEMSLKSEHRSRPRRPALLCAASPRAA